jgi:hypothetical protein
MDNGSDNYCIYNENPKIDLGSADNLIYILHQNRL